jgi:glutamate racemase
VQQQAIAILDSGVGGLTVVKEVMRQLPREQILFFGDSGRAPYGPRPAEEVRSFAKQIVEYLMRFNPKMIVIACNTAAAVALHDIQEMVDIPVIGVIQPGARAVIKATKTGVIGVIGTVGTINSGAYEKALNIISPHLKLYSLACPKFVPLVEKGLYKDESAIAMIRESLEPIIRADSRIDSLILGCTHYPFLAPLIERVMGPRVTLISSAEETAREISALLYHKGLLEKETTHPDHRFMCSGDPELFRKIAREWLERDIDVTPVHWEVPQLSD